MTVIDQILLLKDERSIKELSEPLVSLFREVEGLFNFGEPRAEFRHWWLNTEDRPEMGPSGFSRIALADDFWKAALGRYASTYDAGQLGEFVDRALPPEGKKLIVTDQELVPPPDWRYIIWDECTNGEVVSTVPTDPEYWGNRNAPREVTIKQRVRSACMNVVGGFLGLSRCQNERCFMFENVDSVMRLDNMVLLGEEHGIAGLSNKGYSEIGRAHV